MWSGATWVFQSKIYYWNGDSEMYKARYVWPNRKEEAELDRTTKILYFHLRDEENKKYKKNWYLNFNGTIVDS